VAVIADVQCFVEQQSVWELELLEVRSTEHTKIGRATSARAPSELTPLSSLQLAHLSERSPALCGRCIALTQL